MNKPEDMQLPALGGITKDNLVPRLIRPLTKDDESELSRSRKVYSLASPQIRMFGMMVRNYQELQNYADAFLKQRPNDLEPLLELNRHVFNYIASASGVLDHFDRLFKKQTRRVSNPDTEFVQFRKKLEKNDDVFEFFSEYRNFALHEALPVGGISEKQDISDGRSIKVVHKVEDLVSGERRQLKKCRLLKSKDEIELLPLLVSFHQTMMTKVFQFIVDCFLPGLIPAQRYHEGLGKEVRAVDPNLIPVIVDSHDRQGNRFEYSSRLIPDDLFGDLGIKVKVNRKSGDKG